MNLKIVRHLPEAEIQSMNWEINIMNLQSHTGTYFAFPLSTQGLIIQVKGDIDEDKTIIQSIPVSKNFEIIIPLPMISYSKYKSRILRFTGLENLNNDWKCSIRDYRQQNEFPVDEDGKVLLRPVTLYSLERKEEMLWVKKNRKSRRTGIELVIKSGER